MHRCCHSHHIYLSAWESVLYTACISSTMLDLEQVKKRLVDSNLVKVAASAGLSYPAVYRLMNKDQAGVHYITVKKLSDYLESRE